MGRSSMLAPTQDPVTDGGTVLISIIQGEQDEIPVRVNFVDVLDGHEIEAVIIEALNDGAGTQPIAIKPAGVQTVLSYTVSVYRGTFNGTVAYSKGEHVLFEEKYYRRIVGVNVTDVLTPDLNDDWVEDKPNVLYVRLPKELSVTPAWEVQPTVGNPTYGFFEVRITETSGSGWDRTWKPTRGLIEVRFSPTAIVADVVP